MAPDVDFRLDDLARKAGVATTTVRLYQAKGLLAGPRLQGRTGYYGEHHLARLALIGRLQEQGFSLAGIRRLLDTWENGRDLADLVGVEEQLDALLGGRHAVVLTAGELFDRFPPDALSPELLARAVELGLVEATEDGRFRVPDARFLETGSALIRLGVPGMAVLDEWARLTDLTDRIAEQFIGVFETHVLPPDWAQALEPEHAAALATTLAQLRDTASRVVAAALDASIARVGAERLAALTAAAGRDP